MSWSRIDNVEEMFNEGDPIQVKIVDVDKKTGKLRLSARELMPKPEGYVEREPRQDFDRPRNDDRGGYRNDRNDRDRGPRNNDRDRGPRR
jgi:polyribonucleotide nucleotidyltransferase